MCVDTCVTVVDCSMFFRHLQTTKRLRESGLAEPSKADTANEGEQMTCELLIKQVEFADVILLNKTDLLGEDDLKKVKATLEMLNQRARVIPCSYSQVRLKPSQNAIVAMSHAALSSFICVIASAERAADSSRPVFPPHPLPVYSAVYSAVLSGEIQRFS